MVNNVVNVGLVFQYAFILFMRITFFFLSHQADSNLAAKCILFNWLTLKGMQKNLFYTQLLKYNLQKIIMQQEENKELNMKNLVNSKTKETNI